MQNVEFRLESHQKIGEKVCRARANTESMHVYYVDTWINTRRIIEIDSESMREREANIDSSLFKVVPQF